MELTIVGKDRRARAQGMVEFALILPVLLLLIYGIMEFGRLLFIYTTVNTASREAARYGSAAGYNGNVVYRFDDCAGMRAAAKNAGVLASLQDSDITIEYDSGPGTSKFPQPCETNTQHVKLKDRVVVTVRARFVPVVPILNLSEIPITSVAARTIVKDVVVGSSVQ